MLQKEFEERIGKNISPAEFEEINDIYMNCPDYINKDIFCAMYEIEIEWKMLQDIARLNKEKELIKNDIKNTTFFMIDQSEQYASIELRNKAIFRIGFKEYIKYKLKKGYNLWDIDKKDLLNNL